MGEFRIGLWIGNVAAGGYVKIMDRNGIAQAGAVAEFGGNVTAIGLAAERMDLEPLERQPGENDHAVIALLAV